MSSSLGRSRVADLSFRLLGRAVHPEFFTTRAHRRVALDGWSADIRIIDGGHAVSWRAGAIRLTEIFAEAALAWPEAEVLLSHPIRHERTAIVEPGSGVEYQTSFEVERLDPEVFTHLCGEMTLDNSRDRLFYESNQGNRLAPLAISHLAFESRARGFLIHTFHSFPAELAIVRTQSLFETPRSR